MAGNAESHLHGDGLSPSSHDRRPRTRGGGVDGPAFNAPKRRDALHAVYRGAAMHNGALRALRHDRQHGAAGGQGRRRAVKTRAAREELAVRADQGDRILRLAGQSAQSLG